MKLVLAVLSFFTGTAIAHAADWYATDSRACSTGTVLESSAQTDTALARFQISEDFKSLTIETTNGDVKETRHFNLTLMGKNAYLASPVSGGDENDYFFVSTGDLPARLLISAADRMGESCNGGLILTTANLATN
jgi:hypothetical protein